MSFVFPPQASSNYDMKKGVFWDVTPCGSWLHGVTATRLRATRRNTLEDAILLSHHRENLKSYTIMKCITSSYQYVR
jgi:hypothetical protein